MLQKSFHDAGVLFGYQVGQLQRMRLNSQRQAPGDERQAGADNRSHERKAEHEQQQLIECQL